MIDDGLINGFLDDSVRKAKENLAKNGQLDLQDAIPLMLKSQFNHIRHLEQEMVTQSYFEQSQKAIESRLSGVESKISDMESKMVTTDLLEHRLSETKNDILKWFVGIFLAQTLTLTGIFIGVIHIIH